MRFWGLHKIFIFHPILMEIFFIGFFSKRASRICTADFFYLLPFSRYKGPKRAKLRYLRPHEFFIFHPILMGFFSLNSSQWELPVVCQQIFSISYHFRDIRGQRGQKCDFGGYIKFSFFIQFCQWDFFHWNFLNENFQNYRIRFFLSLTVFKIQGTQKAKNVILGPT